MSSSLRARNFFWGCVYISQNVHWFQEQPLVTWRIKDLASLGGRKTGSMYCTGNINDLLVKKLQLLNIITRFHSQRRYHAVALLALTDEERWIFNKSFP